MSTFLVGVLKIFCCKILKISVEPVCCERELFCLNFKNLSLGTPSMTAPRRASSGPARSARTSATLVVRILNVAVVLGIVPIAAAASTCEATLVAQHSKKPCRPGISFGCSEDSRSIWTKNCRGEFRCGAESPSFFCGYPPGQDSYRCSCDGHYLRKPALRRKPARQEAGLATATSKRPSCAVELVEQTSRTRCILGRSFGCLDNSTIWVKNCRGSFRCSTTLDAFDCGYPPGDALYHCSCNAEGMPAQTQNAYRQTDLMKSQHHGCRTVRPHSTLKNCHAPERQPIDVQGIVPHWHLAGKALGFDLDVSAITSYLGGGGAGPGAYEVPLFDQANRRRHFLCTATWRGRMLVYVEIFKVNTLGFCGNLAKLDDKSNATGRRPFVFTFVRDPFTHFISAYSDYNFKAAPRIKQDEEMMQRCPQTHLQWPVHSLNRAQAYIRDYVSGAFNASARCFVHLTNLDMLPQSAFLVAALNSPVEHVAGFDFIGRLENASRDWDRLGRKVVGATKPPVWPAFEEHVYGFGECRGCRRYYTAKSSHVHSNAAAGSPARLAMQTLLNVTAQPPSTPYVVAMCRVLLYDYVCFGYPV